MSPRGRCILACLLLSIAQLAVAEGLRYRLEGLDDEARDNVVAYLGEAPEDLAGAERFLVTAPDRVGKALEAVGIYDYSLQLDVDRGASPWQLRIAVTHGERVRFSSVDLTLQGAGARDEALAQVVSELAPAVGDALHHGRYEDFKDALLRRARERGYFDARFTRSEVRVNGRLGEAAAILRFASGERSRFGPVSADDDLLSARLLGELLPFDEGDYYQQSRLLELRSRLLRLGYFSSVVVVPELGARVNGTVPITIDLLPAPRHSYEVGVGFSTDTRQRLSLVWSSPRLNRHGHSQRTRLRYSPVNPALNTLYTVPLDAAATDLLQFGARLEDNEFGDLNSTQRELLLQRERSFGAPVVSYHLRALRESWNIVRDDFDATYTLAGASYSRRDRRGNVVDPEAGLSQFYALELAAGDVGSEQDLLRLQAGWTAARRFGERSRVFARLNAGILFAASTRPEDLPPSLSFFAGGDSSIRGFAYQSVGRELSNPLAGEDATVVVGGTRLLTGTLEYQRYVFGNWRGALFVDAGDAFADNDLDLKVAVGFGIHYMTPLGALRLELAKPVSAGGGDVRLHINIGAEL